MSNNIYNLHHIIEDKHETLFLEAGIHENIHFESIRVDETVNGNRLIEFKFADNSGKSTTATEWEPKLLDQESEADFNERRKKQMTRINDLVAPFLTKEERAITASSFKEFGNKLASALQNKTDNKLVRLKVTYNGNYASIPKQTDKTVIESMDIPSDQSKIQKLSFDKFERPETDKEDVRIRVTNKDSEMPF